MMRFEPSARPTCVELSESDSFKPPADEAVALKEEEDALKEFLGFSQGNAINYIHLITYD